MMGENKTTVATRARLDDDDDIQDYKKPWVGLTDDAEILAISNTMPYANRFEFARAIEQFLKEKNA